MAGKAHNIGDPKESDQRLRLLVQSIMTTTDRVSITDVDDKILFINKSFTDTYGYTEEELLGKNIAIVRSPLMDPDIGAEIARETLKSGWNGEVLNRHKDGTDFSLELWTSAVRDEAGIPYALVGVARDLSDRKKTEAEIRRSNTKYQLLFENANDSIIIFRPGDEKILEVNRKACEVYGYTREEFTSLNLHSITLDPDYGEMIAQAIVREEKDGHLSSVHYGKNGNAIHVHSYVYVIDYTGDQAIVSINRDITSRVQTEARLRENEERLRLISENVTDYLAILDAKGIYHYVTDSYRLLGYDPSAILGTSIFSYVHPDDKVRFANEMKIVTDTYSSRSFEFQFKRNTGGWMNSEIVINVMVGDSGSELVIAMRDITERIRREEDLQKFSMAIKQNPASIMITDARGIIEYVNPKFTEMTGYSLNDVVGQNVRMLRTEETSDPLYDEILRHIQEGKEWRGELRSQRKNGEPYVEKVVISPMRNAQGTVTHFLSISEDITKKHAV
jgi:PAS domain S-box-containing protein